MKHKKIKEAAEQKLEKLKSQAQEVKTEIKEFQVSGEPQGKVEELLERLNKRLDFIEAEIKSIKEVLDLKELFEDESPDSPKSKTDKTGISGFFES